jgi:hypothetical protein
MRAPATQDGHSWVRKVAVAHVPGHADPVLDGVITGMLERFRYRGHGVHATPQEDTDALITTAEFGRPLGWRQSLLFTARRRLGIEHSPTVFTLMRATPDRFAEALAHFDKALGKTDPDPADFAFPGLAATAYRTLYEQGKRGGSIMALERLLQAQSKSVRIILVIGDDRPEEAYHFDLVGAFPRSDGRDADPFYDDIVNRMATTLSTREVVAHETVPGSIDRATWDALDGPQAMIRASEELGRRSFFTEPVVIAELVTVPAVSGAVAAQYSEGCFATYEPAVAGIVATVTGSARPIDKGKVTPDDLAVITGIRPGGDGAFVRSVDGHPNSPPSSEAVELAAMDLPLPTIDLGPEWAVPGQVPVVRSKLHGHRGVAAYDPARVEYAPLAPEYHRYLVSCASEAQASGVHDAFGASVALQNPADPRQLVFTVLPGHGIIIAEKWIAGTEPFQLIWEAIDDGAIEVVPAVPQGPFGYVPAPDDRMVID